MILFKKIKQMISLALCAALLFAMAGCGKSGEAGGKDTSSGSKGSKTDDSVVDMGGYEFTIASPFLLDQPVLSEVTEAEAIFEEIRHKVETDYNCKITIIPSDNTVQSIRTKIIAGEKIADLVDITAINTKQIARAGYVVPLENVDGIDISDSRWIKGYTNLTEFNDQHYGLNFMRPVEARMCLIYNRDLLKKCGITEDPQALVTDKKWTFDKFKEMCKACTKDNNGDGINDSYGVYAALIKRFVLSLINANGGNLVTSENGVAKESFNDSKVLTALNFASDLINKDKVTDYNKSGDNNGSEKTSIANFVSGGSAFYFCETWQINQLLKPTAGSLDYGLLPLPMGPDAEDYVSPSQNARNFAITSTNKDVDKTVTIFNALARYTEEYGDSEDWWHYELEKDYFQDGDTASVDMYLLLLDKASCDMGVGVSELWDYFMTQAWETCYLNKGTFASKIESITGKYQSAIDAVYN